MFWTFLAASLAGFSTWNLCKCTLFAKAFERESIDYMLNKFGKRDDPAAVFAAERVALEFRLRCVPVWLIATLFGWAFFLADLVGKK